MNILFSYILINIRMFSCLKKYNIKLKYVFFSIVDTLYNHHSADEQDTNNNRNISEAFCISLLVSLYSF